MKVINIIAIILLLWSFQANLGRAQTQELKVGDKLPNQLLEIINNNSAEPKPTIINFWATWCVPCIKELRLLDSVLRVTDRINILSVTYEEEETIASFFERNDDLKSGPLTVLHSDTLFNKSFPHRGLPHNIWIDANGIVQNITGGDGMTDANIQLFAKGKHVDTREKKDIVDFKVFAPFHLSDSEFISRSILTERIDGILSGETTSGLGFADKRVVDRVFCYNSMIHHILWTAVTRGVSPSNFYNTMRIETNDSLRFFSPTLAPLSFEKSEYSSVHEWRKDNTYCYELRLPKHISGTQFYSYMLNDLERTFNVKIESVYDSILCSIITCENTYIPIANPSDSTFINIDGNQLVAQNVSVLSLFQFLNETVKDGLNDLPIDPPFIDRTGGLRIDVHLNFNGKVPKYEHIKELIKEKYGINIHHQKDEYKITIVKDMG